MSVRAGLRAIAVAVAFAALLDPSLSLERERSEPLTIVALDEEALGRATQLRDAASEDSEAVTWLHDDTAAAAACPAVGACVLVSAGDVARHATAGARVLAVVSTAASHKTDGQAGGPVLRRIDAPARVHRDAAATLRIATSRPVQRIDVFDGDTLVGSASPQNETAVDLQWVPVAVGARALRIVADGEVAHVGVIVESTPAQVLFYEPQATWLGTFVRRALEDDTRFVFRGRTRVAPAVAVSRGEAGALSATALATVGTVIVTAPEMLTAVDVDLLERFVAVRGGSLIIAADQRPSGTSLRLLPRVIAEHREPEPRSLGLLRATEWLHFDAPSGAGVSTLAAIEQQPVIVTRAIGRGRVIASGALDAWRFRESSDGFRTFWTALAWDAATVAGPTLRVDSEPTIAEPGEAITVNVELQSMDAHATAVPSATGSLTCGDNRRYLRLWPGARPLTFTGTIRGDAVGECAIEVTVGDVTGTTPVTFRDDLRSLRADDEQLEALAAAHGARFVDGETDEAIVSAITEQLATRREAQQVWPMRSPYWLIPFALCLGGEWWLRRQAGLS